jgi:hypothetical protein
MNLHVFHQHAFLPIWKSLVIRKELRIKHIFHMVFLE